MNKTFYVTGSESERYGDIVNKTARLLKKPYFQMHSIFTKEKWTVEEIERAYQIATKHNGTLSSEVAWWVYRKKRNAIHRKQS